MVESRSYKRKKVIRNSIWKCARKIETLDFNNKYVDKYEYILHNKNNNNIILIIYLLFGYVLYEYAIAMGNTLRFAHTVARPLLESTRRMR